MLLESGGALPSRRVAVVGHKTWFVNHYPEGWEQARNIRVWDVNERQYTWFTELHQWKPDVTLFYRPELYPRESVAATPGVKIGFLSEPVSLDTAAGSTTSSETILREDVYSKADWSAFDKLFYYDASKSATVNRLGWPPIEFRPLPFDTTIFYPDVSVSRDIDFFFIGKPTQHRIDVLDFLRSAGFVFVWIAHGISGLQLARYLQRSKVVLNVHADGLRAYEPRIDLALACGGLVMSEPVPRLSPLHGRILDIPAPWNEENLCRALELSSHNHWTSDCEHWRRGSGVLTFVEQVLRNF